MMKIKFEHILWMIICIAIISCKPHATEPTITETVNKNDPRYKWTGVYVCNGTYSVHRKQGDTLMTVKVKMNGDTGMILGINDFNVKLDTINNTFIGHTYDFPGNYPYNVGGQFFRSLEVDSISLFQEDISAPLGAPVFVDVLGKKMTK